MPSVSNSILDSGSTEHYTSLNIAELLLKPPFEVFKRFVSENLTLTTVLSLPILPCPSFVLLAHWTLFRPSLSLGSEELKRMAHSKARAADGKVTYPPGVKEISDKISKEEMVRRLKVSDFRPLSRNYWSHCLMFEKKYSSTTKTEWCSFSRHQTH